MTAQAWILLGGMIATSGLAMWYRLGEVMLTDKLAEAHAWIDEIIEELEGDSEGE